MKYSQAKRVHIRVRAGLQKAGLTRVRSAVRKVTAPGYKALFAGPPMLKHGGKRAAVPVFISQLDADVAEDLGELNELIETRITNALHVYKDMVQQGPAKQKRARKR